MEVKIKDSGWPYRRS